MSENSAKNRPTEIQELTRSLSEKIRLSQQRPAKNWEGRFKDRLQSNQRNSVSESDIVDAISRAKTEKPMLLMYPRRSVVKSQVSLKRRRSSIRQPPGIRRMSKDTRDAVTKANDARRHSMPPACSSPNVHVPGVQPNVKESKSDLPL